MSANLSLIQAAHQYIDAQEAFVREGGERFFNERVGMRTDFCHLSKDLSEDQIERIKNSFPEGPVRNEVEGRLNEWISKLKDGKITHIQENPISNEEFEKHFVGFYKNFENLLNSSAYQRFLEIKDKTRDQFISKYKEGVSVEEVAKDLKDNGIDQKFIDHATHEWGHWKSKK